MQFNHDDLYVKRYSEKEVMNILRDYSKNMLDALMKAIDELKQKLKETTNESGI